MQQVHGKHIVATKTFKKISTWKWTIATNIDTILSFYDNMQACF